VRSTSSSGDPFEEILKWPVITVPYSGYYKVKYWIQMICNNITICGAGQDHIDIEIVTDKNNFQINYRYNTIQYDRRWIQSSYDVYTQDRNIKVLIINTESRFCKITSKTKKTLNWLILFKKNFYSSL
jgi:hypothetical protein